MSTIDRRLSRIHERLRRLRWAGRILALLLIVAGSLLIWQAWTVQKHNLESNAVRMARLASAAISTNNLSELQGQESDQELPEYAHLKQALSRMKEAYPETNSIYLYRDRGDDLIYLVDSEPIGSPGYSIPGTVYQEAPDSFWLALEGTSQVVTASYSDRLGRWVSVLTPLYDNETGDLIAIFAMDYTAAGWLNTVRAQTGLVALVFLLLFMVLIGFYLSFKRNLMIRRDKESLNQVNQQLIDQETMFRTLFEQSPIGMSIGSIDSAYIDVNTMYETITGYSKDQLRAHNWKEHTHPDDVEADVTQLERFMAGEIDGYAMIKRFVRPDGEIVWVHMTIAPLSIGEEDDLYYLCMIESIDDYMQAVEQLRESERSKDLLLSNLPGMAYRCKNDADWTMLYVSDGCHDLTGYSSDALLNNNQLSFNELITPEFRDILFAEWKRVLVAREKFRYEYTIRTAGGQTKWVYEQGQGIYSENGQVLYLDGMIIDISELKSRENEIQYMINHDFMTGLYNRNYFNSIIQELDVPEKWPLTIIVGDINGLRLVNDAFGHASGDELIRMTAHTILSCCREQDVVCRTGGDEFSILLPRTSASEAFSIMNKMRSRVEENQIVGEKSFTVNLSLGYATKKNEVEAFSETLRQAEEHMNKRKLLEARSSHSAIISSIKATMFARSQETEQHAARMASYGRAIGEHLKLTQFQLYELELLATLHDIGKVGIDDRILNKPGKLTQEEWKQMKKHPEIGYRIAMSSPELTPIAEYILSHHERWDGTGYPQGLQGEQIPLLSRVIAVVDAYDAMTEERVYNRARTREEAIAEIEFCSGSQFDPNIAALFVELLKTGSLISDVKDKPDPLTEADPDPQ